ncbi:MAG: InlB B-repeat-containing protein, partial [Paraprevotella sp.]|nr:InlB B-repeat-containing protein [Paraprevotella sp.]
GEVYKTVKLKYRDLITPEPEPQKEGHTFSGWIGLPEVMPAKDVIVTGSFSVNVYKLTYVVDGKIYKKIEVKFGDKITPEPDPQKEGYTFSGWSNIPEFMPAKNITVTGRFTINTAIKSVLLSDREVVVYNLNGTKLYEYITMREALKKLPKGIYIINGRKIYIK